MGKLIVIRLEEGSFEKGFPVVLSIAEDGQPFHHQPETSSLPANAALDNFYKNLKKCYEELEKTSYNYETLSTLYSQYNLSSDDFKKILNNWLNSGDFQTKWDQICTHFTKDDNIRVVLQIKDRDLAKLPWHLWNFFDNYPLAEVAFSLSEFKVKPCYQISTEVRILVIDGGRVDSSIDKEEIEKLSPDATLLKQPDVDTIVQKLEEEEWDILFFVGHSTTSKNKGILYINEEDKVTIDKFKNAVNKALSKRLRLAIFNSCHGLGLATTLASWNFPQVIVMRLPIPDVVAHNFLKSFIPAFKQPDKTLYLALREAREKLQELEENDSNEKSILASWLPVIYDQAFVQRPLTWQQLPITREKPIDPPYIERPPLEQTCYEAVEKPGGLIRIKAPKKMGKTLLLNKILDYAKSKGYKTVNLQFSDPKFLENYETCFKTFCSNVSVNLNIEDKTNEYWTTYQTSDSFTSAKFYFQNYLLSTIETNLVIGLNHFEIFFKNQKIFESFCALLRDFHDFGKSTDEIGQIWRKLRIVIVNSTEKYPELNINHSPFNVGVDINERIGLRPFTETEAKKLLDHYQLEQKLNEQDFKSLITLVSGHPYLIQQAFAYLKKYKEHTISELFETASTEQCEVFIEHLRKLLNSLEENDLKESYKKVLTESNVKLDSTVGFKLHSLGLIKFSGNYAISSCDLYTKYFSEHLVDKQTKIGGNND